MWLPLLIYLLVILKNIYSFEIPLKNEPTALIDLFIENLKVDPSLLVDHGVSAKSEQFISNKTDKFVQLVSESQNAEFSRTKRSLDNRDTSNTNKFSINIYPEKIIPTHYSEDLRLFHTENDWFAVSLEDKTGLTVYQYLNGTFDKIYHIGIQYNTNVAVLSNEYLPFAVVGENGYIKVFQFNVKKKKMEDVQSIKVAIPKHVALWEQDRVVYLSITENQPNNSENGQPQKSAIKIYRWLGRHFDHVQDIELYNIKKTVPFNIHGSYFLAAVKYEKHEDEIKTFSEILKFDMHSTTYEPYQRLLTNNCTDIKYFTSELHGENHYFLVVVHSVSADSSKTNESVSVLYKYEDQYFIPFQTIVTNAVEWQPIQDLDGNAALIAVTKDGLKGFQYDGWHFFESNIISNADRNILRFEDIQALHTYDFDGKQILVIACDHCKNTTINVYAVNFTNFNALKELYSQTLTWCIESLKELDSNSSEPDFVAKSLRADINEQISEEEDQRRQLSAALTESTQILYNIEDALKYSLPSDKEHIFDGSIEADTIIFNNSTSINSLHTPSLNDVGIDSFFDNVLDIVEGFNVDGPMEFNIIVSKKQLKPMKMNNVPLERFVFVDHDLVLEKLSVHGSVIFKNGINVQNVINNVSVSARTLLLRDVDQTFVGNLRVNEIEVDNLRTGTLNGLDPNAFRGFNNDSQEISHIRYLKVKDLHIDGLLNRVSVPVLAKRALKKVGNQFWEEPFSFNSLQVDSIIVGGNVSGKQIPKDFVMTDSGEYELYQDVEFVKGIRVNKLEVQHSLNNISVTESGTLDLLLIDSSDVQIIPVKKTFENLVVTNPIKIRNKINNGHMLKLNPVMIDSDSYNLAGDVTINGRVGVTQLLKVDDLKPQDGVRSLGEVLEKGVKLSDTQIPVHLTFTQALDLRNVNANKINSRNPKNWLLATSNISQTITGRKRFLGDLHLKGHVNASKINGVDVQALEKEVLRTEGDQEIEGVWMVDRVVTKEGITGNQTHFKGSQTSDKNIKDTLVINGNLIVKDLKTTHLQVEGLINSKNISETLKNLVRKDVKHKVFGKKEFKELHIDDLIIQDEHSSFLQLLEDVTNDQVTLQENLDLFSDICVTNLVFSKNINNISKENFDGLMSMKSDNDDTAVVASDMEYDEIVVFGEVFVADNFINGKNMTSTNEDSVKVDEDHEFGTVRFGEAVTVKNTLQLDGNIENLDLDTIVEQDAKEVITVQDKTFMGAVLINGTLYINNTVSGLDLNRFCEFTEPSEKLKSLKIYGDVVFVRGPKILNINGLNVKHLKDTLWLSDKAVNISGTIHLRNATFNGPVHVLEFVDANNLNLISKNYLSKSKNQTVSACLAFDDVTFANISTPFLTTNGPINSILIDDILKTMLLQDFPQVFESPVYFEEVTVQGLNEDSDYTVNGLNLETDVMRYDEPNVVTGRKIFKNLTVDTIRLTHNVKIQNVDVLDWLGNAVLTNGSFRIKGKKVLKSGTFKRGLSLRGELNGQEFNDETVMLIDTIQNITGRKTFFSNDKEPTKFKSLRIKGLANGVDIEKLVGNQSNKHGNMTLSSEVIFDKDVIVKNINVGVLYNNVNISELIANVSRLRNLEHLQDKFESLLDMGIEVDHSIKGQTTLFKYYKEVMQLDNVYDVFGVKCKDGTFRLLALYLENGTSVFRTFEWNPHIRTFSFSGENIESHSRPNYLKQIAVGDKDYLYIEHLLDNNPVVGPIYSGKLLQLINSTTFELAAEFDSNETVSLISFVNPSLSQACLGFIRNTLSEIDIYCDETGQYGYYWSQRIPMEGVYQATCVETEDSVYLFLARHGLSSKEPSIVVLQSRTGFPDFTKIQTIFASADLNGLAAASIGGVPYVAFSFGSQEETVESGWISIRRLDSSTNLFLQWQYIPITSPIGIHFVTQTSFEPLLVIPSADASAPLQTFRTFANGMDHGLLYREGGSDLFGRGGHVIKIKLHLRYEGVAGFTRILKGSALPISSKVRILGKGHFLVTVQEDRSIGTILGAVIKGSIGN